MRDSNICEVLAEVFLYALNFREDRTFFCLYSDKSCSLKRQICWNNIKLHIKLN